MHLRVGASLLLAAVPPPLRVAHGARACAADPPSQFAVFALG
jgi:hypothetical protein